MKTKKQSIIDHYRGVNSFVKKAPKDWQVVKTSATPYIDVKILNRLGAIKVSSSSSFLENIVVEVFNKPTIRGILFSKADIYIYYFYHQKKVFIVDLKALKNILSTNSVWKDFLETSNIVDTHQFFKSHFSLLQEYAKSFRGVLGRFNELGSMKGVNLLIPIDWLKDRKILIGEYKF